MKRNALVTHAQRYAGPDAADALAAAGYEVYCHDLQFTEQAAREAYCQAHPGITALAESPPEAAVAAVLAEQTPIDVLFANHFQVPESLPLEETDADGFRQLLEGLLVEPYRFIKPVAAQMKSAGGGRIIVMTSAAPLKPGPQVSLYSAARAGANSLVKTLAKELGPAGIGVFAIAPNFYASDDTYSRSAFQKSERFRAMVERQVPLGRLSAPDEMRELIRYLASEESLFITGQVIAFTGGWS